MSKIIAVRGRQVLDSRGNPTVEVEVESEKGCGRAIVPSGASTGTREAHELRDGEENRYQGKGVTKAVYNVNNIIAQNILGENCLNQMLIDTIMLKLDETETKRNLGANAILGVSMAVARAGAASCGIPLYRYLGGIGARQLPMPMMNIINGGVHADNNIDIQEFMIVPVGAKTFEQGLQMGTEVFHALKKVLKSNGLSTNVGDEGGFAPLLDSNEDAIQMIMEAVRQGGYKEGDDIKIALDIASSELYKEGCYYFASEGKTYTSTELIDYYDQLCEKYPIISIEDGLDENDWDGWLELTKRLGKKVQLVGDDLFVTNPKVLEKGIMKNIANAVLVKINQIGTITETLTTIRLAKHAGYATVISHRSGESEDVFISDLAEAVNAGQIKTGSLCRSDRVAKYNQLLRIEEDLKESAIYSEKLAFYNL